MSFPLIMFTVVSPMTGFMGAKILVKLCYPLIASLAQPIRALPLRPTLAEGKLHRPPGLRSVLLLHLRDRFLRFTESPIVTLICFLLRMNLRMKPPNQVVRARKMTTVKGPETGIAVELNTRVQTAVTDIVAVVLNCRSSTEISPSGMRLIIPLPKLPRILLGTLVRSFES